MLFEENAKSFIVTVSVELKTGVFDPAAAQVQKTLVGLDFPMVSKTVMGKFFRLTLDALDEPHARKLCEDMASKLLANPVMEKFDIVSIRPG